MNLDFCLYEKCQKLLIFHGVVKKVYCLFICSTARVHFNLLIVEVGHLSPISELVVREVTGSIPVGDSESESFFVPRLCRID